MAKSNNDKAPQKITYKEKVEHLMESKTVQKMFKDGKLIFGEDEIKQGDIEPIVTRFPSLNLSIGIGGLPRGKVIEISGKEGSFKSSLCWAVAADVQKNEELVAWIDAEHAVDLHVPKMRRYFKSLGVDMSKILLFKPDTTEEAFEAIETLFEYGVSLIVYDSIVALSNVRESEADMEKIDRNTNAMSINKGLRKITPALRKYNCTLLLINQFRVNQDRMNKYAPEFQTTGGQGLKHWCSLRLEVRAYTMKDTDKRPVGKEIYVKVIKTRFDFPRDDAQIFYFNATGFSIVHELANLAETWGVFKPIGRSWIYTSDTFGEVKLAKTAWYDKLNSDEELRAELTERVIEAYEEYFAPSSSVEMDALAEIEREDDEEE